MEPGTVLRGKYRIERLLGAGGMGQVHLATHLRMGQKVAVKVLNESGRERSEMVERFAREARAAAQLTSDHVVRILDVDETEDRVPFFVMEYLVGEDLEAVLRRDGVFPIARAVDALLEAMEGIAEAHARGIVHRDLKPANLFVAKRPTGTIVKVLDFGISKSLREDESNVALTTTQSVIGSPLYMSPEQLRASRDADARSDVWSLGVVLYQMLTGTLPFSGTSATAVAACIAADAPVPLREKRADVPAALEAVVLRCLEKLREDRYASVVELAQALAPFAARPERAEDVERAANVQPSSGSIGLAATHPTAKTGRKTETLGEADAPGASTEAASVSSRSVQPAPPPSRPSRVLAPVALAALAALAVGWMVANPTSTSTETPPSPSAAAWAGPSTSAPSSPLLLPLPSASASTSPPTLTADTAAPARALPVSSPRRVAPRRNPLDVDIK